MAIRELGIAELLHVACEPLLAKAPESEQWTGLKLTTEFSGSVARVILESRAGMV